MSPIRHFNFAKKGINTMFKKCALTLAMTFVAIAPQAVLADDEAMRQEIRQLAERIKQLEASLDQSGDKTLAARVDDVEGVVVALRDKPSGNAAFEGVSFGASLVMTAQKAKGLDAELNARADIEVELPMGSIGDAEGKLFGHLRAGDGEGVDPGLFATANATVFGDFPQPVLMQAWYQLDVPVGAASGRLDQVEFTVGKIDPFGFFDGNNIADDETETFMNLAFIHNPLLDAGGDIGVGEHGASPGLRLAYVTDINGSNHFGASLGVFGASDGANYKNSFSKPLTIGQLEYAGKIWNGLEGAYRLYAWNNANATNADDDSSEKHSGFGLSVDQQVAGDITLFARYGDSTKGTLAFDKAFTLGAQFSGAIWGRNDDRIGIAYGFMEGADADEKPLELYYALQLNEHVALTADVQLIGNPGGDPDADDVTVWGLRAKASF
jgi:hypothetical protein